MEFVFWFGFAGTWYAYFGYPLVLLLWASAAPRPVSRDPGHRPGISIVLPVHNEERHIGNRISNLMELDYPAEQLEIIVVSDGSTDRTVEYASNFQTTGPEVRVIELPEQGGKAGALNAGVASARHEIIVFTDAAISIVADGLRNLIAPFSDPSIGCVSGEDRIAGTKGEAMYGRYELFLRDRESRVASVVGASGSFYAQRRELIPHFPPGLAPDFVSVLHSVQNGRRAISETAAQGTMTAHDSHSGEFRRKARTAVRGMAALSAYRSLLNPFRSGRFSFLLFSHKLARWSVPLFLVLMVVGNAALLDRTFYRWTGIGQAVFYGLGIFSLIGVTPLTRFLPARIAAYFVNVNAAIALAWWRFLRGERQEVWAPTKR